MKNLKKSNMKFFHISADFNKPYLYNITWVKILFSILFLSTCVNSSSNPDYSLFENPKSSFVPIMLSQPHTANSINGFFSSIHYPGFFSVYGQINLNYNTLEKDTYFLGMGAAFLNVGINKHLIHVNNYDIYSNFMFGKSPDGYLGNFGFSFCPDIDNDQNIEISIDAYMHQGYDGQPIFGKITYRRGVASLVHYTLRYTRNLRITFSAGISLIQYRYMRNNDGGDGSFDQYEYVTLKSEQYNLKNKGYLDSPAWDDHFVFPLGITFKYSFSTQ